MKTEHIRLKRAIQIGLIFSGVSAIGGLLIKGSNAISNYKKSKVMARAMKELYKAQEIDHKCLKRLEHHTLLLPPKQHLYTSMASWQCWMSK